jgi:tRNA (guanine26-N2/guanine27-N2)-dimethyltransferase
MDKKETKIRSNETEETELNFSMKKIKEESAEIFIPIEDKISKKLPVFYNPIMKLNRDITITLLKEFKKMRLCDPLAGSGIRSIRFAKELKYESITANDISKKAYALMEKNMKHNDVKFEIYNKDANILLMESSGFDYIDLDVFGCPNFVLDNAAKRLSRDGILALTATDTSALSGTYPAACKRKYWAKPCRTEIMHEAGIRILARKAQLIAAQYDKALLPIYSFSEEHYFRIFFICKKGKKHVDEIIKQHKMINKNNLFSKKNIFNKKEISNKKSLDKNDNLYLFEDNQHSTKNRLDLTVSEEGSSENNLDPFEDSLYQSEDDSSFGPIWTGQLWDAKLAKKMLMKNKIKECHKLLQTISDEAEIGSIFFYDLHKITKIEKLGYNPRKEDSIKKLKLKGYKASETHFSGKGIRTDAPYEEFVKILKSLKSKE